MSFAKRQKACLDDVHDDAVRVVGLDARNKGTYASADTADGVPQSREDQTRARKFQASNSSSLFEKVLTGRMTLQDATHRGLQLTPEQEQLFSKVRSPATLDLW